MTIPWCACICWVLWLELLSVSVSSAAYLCDRIINELCLYLCSSSNRPRWASFITPSRQEPSCQMKCEPQPETSTCYNKRGGIHGALIRFGDDGSGDACRPRVWVRFTQSCVSESRRQLLTPWSLSTTLWHAAATTSAHPQSIQSQSRHVYLCTLQHCEGSQLFLIKNHFPEWFISYFLLVGCSEEQGSTLHCLNRLMCHYLKAVEESWCKSYWTWHKSCWGAGGEAANMFILICSRDLDPQLHLLMHVHSCDDIGSFTEPKEIHLKL